jgi:MarR family transcriptional regulator for hemolysin
MSGRHGRIAAMKDVFEVRRSLGFLLQETSRLMRRRFVQRAREAGLELNRSESAVLLHVFHTPGISQTALANALDVDTISVVRLIDSLQAAGLIERRPHPTDRRVRTLWLTEAAGAKIVQIKAIAGLVRGQALAGIPEAQGEQLLDLLVAIRSNLAAAGENVDAMPEETAVALS